MASLLHKLLKNQSASRIITTFNKTSQPPNLEPPFLTHLHHHHHNLSKPNPNLPHPVNLIPLLDSPQTEDSIPTNPSHQSQFYPSFPSGFVLTPDSSTALAQSEECDVVLGLPRTESSNPSQKLQFKPSFSSGFFQNPKFSTGLAQSEEFDVVRLGSNPSQQLQFYPSFSVGFFLNPKFSTGFAQSEDLDVVYGDSGTMWMDSVKKKRKKKMNKHKLKKLRKRLRRSN